MMFLLLNMIFFTWKDLTCTKMISISDVVIEGQAIVVVLDFFNFFIFKVCKKVCKVIEYKS